VEAQCRGKKIVAVRAVEAGGGPRDGQFDDIILDGVASADAFAAAVVGRTLVQSRRKGKQMWWQLSGPGPHPTWHFGMTGAFSIAGQPGATYKRYSVDTSAWPPKFTKVEVTFEGGVKLAFSDPRRLGRVRLQADPEKEAPICELGPDALLEMMPLAAFTAELGRRGVPVKAALLDQTFLAGIGNYIADEALYAGE
jgi:formamidopyrimidine-DNA glycosylase